MKMKKDQLILLIGSSISLLLMTLIIVNTIRAGGIDYLFLYIAFMYLLIIYIAKYRYSLRILDSAEKKVAFFICLIIPIIGFLVEVAAKYMMT